MEIILDNKTFKVFITKKNNKNMYLRVKKDGIYITCNYFVTKGLIKSFIEKNKDSILEMDERIQMKEQKKEEFYFFSSFASIICTLTVPSFIFLSCTRNPLSRAFCIADISFSSIIQHL